MTELALSPEVSFFTRVSPQDHFALILNEFAGLVAIVVVKHVVNNIVQAWYEDSGIGRVIETVRQ